MIRSWLRFLGALIILLASIGQPAGWQSVTAQTQAKARINQLDATGFPTIRVTTDVLNADGSFAAGLNRSDFMILENNMQRPVDEVQETANAVGLIVAINGGPIYANRVTSKTHLQLIKDALTAWVPEAQTLNKGDNVTIITNAGVKAVNLATPDEWIAAFNGIPANLTEAVPSLTSLTNAVEQAASAPIRPGVKRSILYITPLVSSGLAKAVASLGEQAAAAEVVINIWLVTPSSVKQPESEQVIDSLAQQTGGQVFRFTGKEALPPIENYLQPLRRQYELFYRSRTNQSGPQSVVVEIQTDTILTRSPEENYQITLKTPNVMFITPVEKVNLKWVQNDNAKDELSPKSVEFPIQIEFLDNHRRNISSVKLLVDGNIVDELHSPPFDRLTWPVGLLKTSGMYDLQVILIDELGFTAKSFTLPIYAEVPPLPPAKILETIPMERLTVAAGALILGVFVIVLLRWQKGKKQKQPSRKSASSQVDSKPLVRSVNVITLPRQPGHTLQAQPRKGIGWLMPLEIDKNQSTQPGLRLDSEIITIGSSPIRSTLIIHSPSVDGLHARILRKNGDYWLEDAGSVSGTWLNNSPVSNLGMALSPGDIIRLGKVNFRFDLR